MQDGEHNIQGEVVPVSGIDSFLLDVHGHFVVASWKLSLQSEVI
jgi:hypothetical protein